MILKHKFYDIKRKYYLSEQEGLMTNDICIYCNLKITSQIIKKLISEVNMYLKINEMNPCLTEEEYTIKKLLE